MQSFLTDNMGKKLLATDNLLPWEKSRKKAIHFQEFRVLYSVQFALVNRKTSMVVVKKTYYTVIQIINNDNGQQKMKRNYLFWIPTKKNKIGISKLKPKHEQATFHEALRATLIVGQLFSLLPVSGICSNCPSKVKFLWSSWKCVYLLVSLMGQIFITTMCIYKVLNSKTSLGVTAPVIFYITACITMLMFLRVAILWPNLVRHIAKVEELDPNYDTFLISKCNVTCAIVLSLALLEHILSLLSAFAGSTACGAKDFTYEGFVKFFYPWVFNFIPYIPLLGAMTQFLHFQSTFIWNFSDLFTICMSYYLTSRLQNINIKLLSAQGKYLPEAFWRTAREDYSRAVQLVRRVDDVINGVVFISFANNLFFICLQLFHTLEDGIKGNGECNSGRSKGRSSVFGGYEAASYFVFSLIYLISRSIAVSLIASQVNTASTTPAPVLYDVPSPVYCIEVQRFLDQVNGDKIALSGLQFFSVTRGLLLTVAGTIVTYELVMFQFNLPPQQSVSTTSPSTIFSLNTTNMYTN